MAGATRNVSTGNHKAMNSFTPYKDRDAWFVIRGYVYQVLVTIFEWDSDSNLVTDERSTSAKIKNR